MKIIIPAFLCLISGVLPFFPSFPNDMELYRNILIPTLALFILLTVAVSPKKKDKEDLFAKLRKSDLESDEELVARLTDRLESLTSENQVLVEGKETLQSKVQELLKEIKEAKKSNTQNTATVIKRDAQIDAELVNLLSIFQEKGRLIDFFMDDITAYPDAQVGAAARVVHSGCAKLLKEYFQIKAIHNAKEGETVELPQGYNTEQIRVVGHVVGEPPFQGKLLHHGWIVEKILLPRLLKSGEELEKHRVITAAEVELQ